MILSKDEDKPEASNSIASDTTTSANKDDDKIQIPSLTESLSLIS